MNIYQLMNVHLKSDFNPFVIDPEHSTIFLKQKRLVLLSITGRCYWVESSYQAISHFYSAL